MLDDSLNAGKLPIEDTHYKKEGGLRVESITPCFLSRHVKSFCDKSTWEKWEESVKEAEIGVSEEKVSVEDIFKEKMEQYKSKGMKPSMEEKFAAVVMADVSGYSKLSNSLAERGAEGAEILCRTMKGYLDKVSECSFNKFTEKIINIILKHGGDIIKFAGTFSLVLIQHTGDAVIFYWKIPVNEGLEEDVRRGNVVLKAAHCCLDLLKLLGSYEVEIPEIGSQVLRIHLGIGAGKIHDVVVGNPGRWEHFIAGDGVNQLASVLDLAKSGICTTVFNDTDRRVGIVPSSTQMLFLYCGFGLCWNWFL